MATSTITVKTGGEWVKFDTLGYTFENGKEYTLQVLGSAKFGDDGKNGILIDGSEPYTFTKKSGVDLYVLTNDSAVVTVSDTLTLGLATKGGSGGGGTGAAVWGDITGTLADQTDLADALSAKQDTLVSGTNIKTINDQSLLGSGNIAISGSVPNQNSAVGATNPLEFWEGTESEYNSGGGSTTYYNWEREDLRIVDDATTSSNYQYTSVAYGNNLCVTCLNDKVKYSSDTINWNDATLPVSINNLIFGNNLFIGYQKNSTSLCVSSDGATWTSVSDIADNIKQIVFGNNVFLMGCADKKFYTSSDGQNWTEVSDATNGIFSIAYANGKFIYADTASSSSRNVPFYISSDNGATWTLLETVSGTNMGEFVYTNGAGNVLYWGISGIQKMSTDGGTTITSDNYVGNKKLTFGNNTYFYLTIGSTQTIYSSSDGTTWTSYLYFGTKMGSGYNPVKDLVYGNNAVISVGGRYINSNYYNSIAIYPSTISVYTTDENPTTESTVYSAVDTPSALTITSVGTGEITCSDTNTYTYNSAGNQTVTQSVGEAHPSWLCNIESVGVKKGNTLIADATGNVLPTQTGNSGKFLTTDGTDASWRTVESLPSQTGNSGKYLTTDGTTASWATVSSGGLQNTATGTNSLTILGTPSTYTRTVNIGMNSDTGGDGAIALGDGYAGALGSIAIGYDPDNGISAYGQDSIAIGSEAHANNKESITIGAHTIANYDNAIALGADAVCSSMDFTVGFGLDQNDNVRSYILLDGTTGKIPTARIGGATGSFTTNDGKTVTVTDGVITSIV